LREKNAVQSSQDSAFNLLTRYLGCEAKLYVHCTRSGALFSITVHADKYSVSYENETVQAVNLAHEIVLQRVSVVASTESDIIPREGLLDF
jgi:hypothetical protein